MSPLDVKGRAVSAGILLAVAVWCAISAITRIEPLLLMPLVVFAGGAALAYPWGEPKAVAQPDPVKLCADCQSWDRGASGAEGQCRAGLPFTFEGDPTGRWAFTRADEWCDDFEPKGST